MPPTVGVVDDDIGFRGLVTRLLRALGFDVVAEACDGAEALARCEYTGRTACSSTSASPITTGTRSLAR